MPIRYRFRGETEWKEVPWAGKTIEEFLISLGYYPEEVVVLRNGFLATEDEILMDGDEVVIIPVISGG